MEDAAFDFIDREKWDRSADFDFFMEADSQIHLCASIEVGPLVRYAAAQDLRFFHCLVYLVGRCVNGIDAFLLSSIHHPDPSGPRVPVRFRHRDASFPVLNDVGNPINLLVDYDADFSVFYRRSVSLADEAKLRRRNAFAEDDGFYVVSYVPVFFTDCGMVSTKKRMQIPAVLLGKYAQSGESASLPVALTFPHAFADGMQFARFFEMLAALCADPSSALGADMLRDDA